MKDLRWMLERGYSVNLYMFDGGTSFGWMNGANSDGTSDGKKSYEPDVTSYDYDVPVAETGALRPKFYVFRDLITSITHVTPPAPPAPLKALAVPPITFNEAIPLWKTLPTPIHSDTPLTMEAVDQSYGYILYRTHLKAATSGTLKLPGVHDYAQVYVDGKLAGTVDRRLQQTELPVTISAAGAQLDILVENTGRVNYGKKINGEYAGIRESPTLAGAPLNGWDIYPLPMLTPDRLTYSQDACTGACFYRASFTVASPEDTFLDTGQLTKGEVWINGRPLGRFWNVGPQQTLYLPGPWLKAGKNELVIFDLDGKAGRSVKGLEEPILDAPIKPETDTATAK